MSVTVLGSRTVGECVPSTVAVNAKLLNDIKVKIAAATKLQAKLAITPPSLAGNLQAAIKIVDQLTLRPALPGAVLDLTAFANVLASLNDALTAAVQFNLAFGVGGLMALLYEGQLGSMGGEITTTVETLFPASNDAFALVLISTSPETRVAMNLVFGLG